MQNNFKLSRPLLNVHRFEIRQFVRFWKLPIYSDRSNQKTHFLRNKIRKQLMPTLRIFFNPQIDTVLLNFLEIRRNEQLYFQNVLNFLLKPQECHPQFDFVFSLIYLSFDVPGESKIRLPAESILEAYPQHKNKHEWINLLSGNVWSDYPEDAFLPAKQPAVATQTIPKKVRKLRLLLPVTPRVVSVRSSHVSTVTSASTATFSRSARSRDATMNPRFKSPRSYVRFAPSTGGGSSLQEDRALLTVQYRDYLNYFSRNQIVYWLVVNNNLVKRLNSYPIIFQKQILKTIFKTFNKVENAFIQSFSFATAGDDPWRSAKEALSLTPMNFLDEKPEKAISLTVRPINLELKKEPPNLGFSEARRRNGKILIPNLGPPSEYDALLTARSARSFMESKIHTPTFGQVETGIKEIYSNNQVKNQTNGKKLTQLLIFKFIKKLFVLQDKRFLLFLVHNLIRKY